MEGNLTVKKETTTQDKTAERHFGRHPEGRKTRHYVAGIIYLHWDLLRLYVDLQKQEKAWSPSHCDADFAHTAGIV